MKHIGWDVHPAFLPGINSYWSVWCVYFKTLFISLHICIIMLIIIHTQTLFTWVNKFIYTHVYLHVYIQLWESLSHKRFFHFNSLNYLIQCKYCIKLQCMVGWHHQLDGHEFEQAPGIGDGQGSLACYSPWGRKESETTEWLNWTELSYIWTYSWYPLSILLL